jgi:hypothetical protein
MIPLVASVRALTTTDRRVLRQAFLALSRVRIALWILPWHRLTTAPHASSQANGAPTTDRLEWSIRVASRIVPHSTCLTKALALHRLLSFYGYRSIVQIGVRNVDGRFMAHAWVEHDSRVLLGTAADIEGYARFFVWPHSRLDRS